MAFKRSAVRSRLSPPKDDKPQGQITLWFLFTYKIGHLIKQNQEATKDLNSEIEMCRSFCICFYIIIFCITHNIDKEKFLNYYYVM